MVVVKERLYEDITEKCFNNKYKKYYVIDAEYFCVGKKKYFVDGKRVVLDYSDKEKEIAKWLGKTFGGKIYMLPRVNKPDGIMTADYLFRNECWDLKTINGIGKRVLEDSIKRKKRQSKNFIFDITNSKIEKESLFQQLDKIYKSKTTDWVDKIIVKKYEDVLVIYKRKQKCDRAGNSARPHL